MNETNTKNVKMALGDSRAASEAEGVEAPAASERPRMRRSTRPASHEHWPALVRTREPPAPAGWRKEGRDSGVSIKCHASAPPPPAAAPGKLGLLSLPPRQPCASGSPAAAVCRCRCRCNRGPGPGSPPPSEGSGLRSALLSTTWPSAPHRQPGGAKTTRRPRVPPG